MADLRDTVQQPRRPLQEDEIRLVYFDGADDSTLNCHTKVMALREAAGSYTALSYAWGMFHPSAAATLDGDMIHITETLRQALTLLWNTEQQLAIWVDFLSISQDDVDEKNRQVSLMGEIFAQSKDVHIWLGEALQGPGDLLFLMKQFGEWHHSFGADFLLERHKDMEREVTHFFRSASTLTTQIRDLTSRAWFYRAWTWQEFTLAPHAFLACGDLTMRWDIFTIAVRTLNSRANEARVSGETPMEAFWELRDLCHLRTSYFGVSTGQPTTRTYTPSLTIPFHDPLWQLLIDTWQRDATDPRDKIYSLLNARMIGCSWVELTPNYRLSVRMTYIRFVRSFVNRTRDLRCLLTARGVGKAKLSFREEIRQRSRLGAAQEDNLIESKLGPLIPVASESDLYDRVDLDDSLPSWTSDWRAECAQDPTFSYPDIHGLNWQHPRRGYLAVPQSIDDFGPTLSVQGCIAGRIALGDDVQRANSASATELFSFMEQDIYLQQLPVCACSSLSNSRANLDEFSTVNYLRFETVRRLSISGMPLPKSSILRFLALSLLHDHCVCHSCSEIGAGQRGRQLQLPPQGQEGQSLNDNFEYTRSHVATGDWLVLLDGLMYPALLRPFAKPENMRWSRASGLQYDRLGMEIKFVGILPLAVVEKLWKDIPCVYGRMDLC